MERLGRFGERACKIVTVSQNSVSRRKYGVLVSLFVMKEKCFDCIFNEEEQVKVTLKKHGWKNFGRFKFRT